MYSIDFSKKIITVAPKFYDKAQKAGSKEFVEMAQLVNAYPNFEIRKKRGGNTVGSSITRDELRELVKKNGNEQELKEFDKMVADKVQFFRLKSLYKRFIR